MTLVPRSVAEVTIAQSLALVPPVVVVGWSNAPGLAPVLLCAATTAIVWEMVFGALRQRLFSAHGITTALIFALLCPTDIALWQLAFAVSMGVVFGELIFGGRGFGFVSPAALSLSLLVVAFPDVVLPATTREVALAVFPGVALLLIVGLISLSVLAGVGFGTIVLLLMTGQAIEPRLIAVALSVGAVFLVADPTAAATTPVGRWLYGVLAGVMVVVFSPEGGFTTEAIVAAALFANVIAPLIDQGSIFLYTRRMRRHG